MVFMMLVSLTGALVQDLISPIPPETGYGPEGPTYKVIIIEDGSRLQPTIIEGGLGDVILSSATGVLKVSSYGRKVDATRNIEEKPIHNSFELHASFAAQIVSKYQN